MARQQFPIGASEIWDMRMIGKKPNGVVFVSMVGPLNETWCVEVRDTDNIDALEWRWALELPVCLVFAKGSDKERIKKLSTILVRQRTTAGSIRPTGSQGHLYLWDVTKQTGWRLSWWAGHEAFPEFDIPGIPEQMTIEPMLMFENNALSGVGLD